MRVLYFNHTATVSGAERSLLDLLSALPASISPAVATPRGPLALAIADLGIPVYPVMSTAGSLKLHPVHTTRALAEMSVAAAQLGHASRQHGADIVHANSVRAGVIAAMGVSGSRATVVHVRDCLPPTTVTRAMYQFIVRRITTIAANSAYTARSVQRLVPAADPTVIYSPVDVIRFDPARFDRATSRAAIGNDARGILQLGVVAQLTPWKGQDTAVRALAEVRDAGVNAHLLLIGSAKFVARATRHDNEAYVLRLRELIRRADLEDRVTWLGEREDVPQLLSTLDILLMPSWEEPFGRVIVEAMALQVPVISTNAGGPTEIVHDGKEGFLVTPHDPTAWAAAIQTLASDPCLRATMGRAGRHRVQQAFSLEHHVKSTLAAYEQTLTEFNLRT